MNEEIKGRTLNELNDTSKKTEWVCEVCGRSFKNDHALRTHIGIMHLQNPDANLGGYDGLGLILDLLCMGALGFLIFKLIKKPKAPEGLDTGFERC